MVVTGGVVSRVCDLGVALCCWHQMSQSSAPPDVAKALDIFLATTPAWNTATNSFKSAAQIAAEASAATDSKSDPTSMCVVRGWWYANSLILWLFCVWSIGPFIRSESQVPNSGTATINSAAAGNSANAASATASSIGAKSKSTTKKAIRKAIAAADMDDSDPKSKTAEPDEQAETDRETDDDAVSAAAAAAELAAASFYPPIKDLGVGVKAESLAPFVSAVSTIGKTNAHQMYV